MSTDCSEKLNPYRVKREGVSQAQRLAEALKPAFVKVDEHQPADWMVMAGRYAEFVRFFNEDNLESGDWRPFFEKDPSAMLAVAAVQKVDFYKANIAQYFKVLLSGEITDSVTGDLRPATDVELQQTFGHLFNALGTLAWQLEVLKEILPKDIALKGVLQNTIQSQLAPALVRLIAYFKAAGSLADTSGSDYGWEILGAAIGQFPDAYQRNFSKDWFKNAAQTDWSAFHPTIAPDASIFGGALMTTVFEKLNYAAAHNLFSGIFDLFVKSYARTVSEAQKSLEKTLMEKDDHEPHYALFLAFLRLLEFARDHLNSLTSRHLDFYYKEILRLKEKAAEPNHAHLLFELAKHKLSHQLKKDTGFKAGKDSDGKNVAYVLDEDFVPNVAKVAELKSVYHSLTGADPKLYALPVANSDDGRGAELTSTDKQWHPFFQKIEDANLANVGFAFASHYLLLGEGHRKIRLTLSFSNPPEERMSQSEFCNAFEFWLTGEKGWVPVALDPTLAFGKAKTATIQVQLVLDGSQPPIVPLSAKVHDGGLPEGLPTLRAVLKQKDAGLVRLQQLQKLRLKPEASSIAVSVGYQNFSDYLPEEAGTGLKKLSISTQLGDPKPDKPYLPFGPQPEVGDFFIVGCDEVFQKKNAEFQFRVTWKGLPDWRGYMDFDWVSEFHPNIKIESLRKGTWSVADFEDYDPDTQPASVRQALNPQTGEVQIFFGKLGNVYFPAKKIRVDEATATAVHFDQTAYSVDRRGGFLKLSLLRDFGHQLYQMTLTRYLMRKGKDPNLADENIYSLMHEYYGTPINPNKKLDVGQYVSIFSRATPIEPYTPEIEALTLSYIASVKLNEEKTGMYWLTPFGYKTANLGSPAALIHAFPDEGEFYIGVKDLMPPQNLSLLFQLAEGSANPTVKKPEEHVQWSYLRGNEWVDFKKTELSDVTGQLTRSGIIRFSVPKDATSGDTQFLPTGHHWLRARVAKRPDAVCRIITVSAQAARATFKDQQNAADFLATQLPAGTIAKLLVPDAAVKKTEQPYPTFGGRPKEATEKFYTRVSERLRHKNRAVTTWDYEHLILEAFPHIYKVKCLNHTHFEPDDNGGSHVYNELAAGHVTIVTVPNLRNHNAIDPLRPYTSLGDLDLIKKFVEKYVSCFVKLHVHNPVFETVRVDFRVKFFPGTDEAFHRELLQNELVRFLSPWAFEEGKDLSFGGKIYKSSLIDFVEEQPYVDYVTDFQLFHQKNNLESPDREEVEASTAISILVSAAAEKHTVTPIPETETAVQAEVCRCDNVSPIMKTTK